MIIRRWILLTAATLCGIPVACANILFSQDFSDSLVLSDYVSQANPNSGQWNALSNGSISDGGLRFERSSTFNRGFARTTDFSPAPEGLIYKFDLAVSGTIKTAAAAVWQVGSGFSTSTTSAEQASKVHSQFGIAFPGTSGFMVRNPDSGVKGSIEFNSKWTITWVINNSPDPILYTAPTGKTHTIQSDHWDLWVGSLPQLLGQTATRPDVPLTDLKMAFTAGTGAIWMDNFSIESIPAVPEPESTGLWATAFMAMFAVGARFRHAFRASSATSVDRGHPQISGEGQ